MSVERSIVQRLFTALILGLASIAFCSGTYAQALPNRLNVLFIAADDLRPALGAYGARVIRTPNMDALARQGVRFTRAYSQQATCSPARTALLTGKRPDTTRVYNLSTHFRDTLPGVVTLPQYFKRHGYFTQSIGKIYHDGLDDPPSWSVPSVFQVYSVFQGPGTLAREIDAWLKELHIKSGNSWQAPDVPDSSLIDGSVADEAIRVLERLRSSSQPFFLAVGFRKPHLPFVAPERYYRLYPDLSALPQANNPDPPINVPGIALLQHRVLERAAVAPGLGELRNYDDISQQGSISGQKAKELVRGYYAATSFADAQVGRVIAALDRLGLRNETIVVLWGDHGFSLGEHGLWGKHHNFEEGVRVPLIFVVPGSWPRGANATALAELVDIYPTLAELAGLHRQPDYPDYLQGKSLVPYLRDPSKQSPRAAFSQWPAGGKMGYSMRTERYRYAEWGVNGSFGIELYDHRTDPGENINIAHRTENAGLVAKLSRALNAGAGWRSNLPLDLVSPARPTGLTARAGNAQVILSWTAPAGAAGYTVLRGLALGGPYITVSQNVTRPSFTDTSVVNGRTYYYGVRAFNNTGASPGSRPVSARPG